MFILRWDCISLLLRLLYQCLFAGGDDVVTPRSAEEAAQQSHSSDDSFAVFIQLNQGYCSVGRIWENQFAIFVIPRGLSIPVTSEVPAATPTRTSICSSLSTPFSQRTPWLRKFQVSPLPRAQGFLAI